MIDGLRPAIRALKYGLLAPLLVPLLALASLLIRYLPFRIIVRRLGRGEAGAVWLPLASRRQTHRARVLKRLLVLALRLSPWGPKCLSQALVASWLLRVLGIPYGVYLGMQRDEAGRLTAHAWVAVGPVQVCGGSAFHSHSVVRMFTRV